MRQLWPWTTLLLGGLLLVQSGCGGNTENPPASTTAPGAPQTDSQSSSSSASDADSEAPQVASHDNTSTRDDKKPAAHQSDSEKPSANDSGSSKSTVPVVPGEAGEPFDAPTLEELDAKVTWVDRPVLDSMVLRRQFDAENPAPISVEEALSLRNNSSEDNEKILLTLGKLPENDDQVNWDDVMVRRLTQDINRTNPIFMSSAAEFDISGYLSFGLFGFDWNLQPFAAADSVKSWQTSEDGMYDKVVMRDDLTWSDGEPITAHDVVFSYRAILTPGVDPPAVKQGTEKVRWIEAYDDQTLVFFHKEPLATNVWNINFPIVPKHIYEGPLKNDPKMKDTPELRKYEDKPVSGGPYELVSRTPGQEIVLRRRESYYMHNGKQVRDKPFYREVRFRVMEDNNTALLSLMTGELDETLLGAAQWVEQTSGNDFYRRNTKVSGKEWTYFYFGWNMNDRLFSDVRVRRAMGYAFDHDEMLRRLNYGLYEPCTGIYHPDAWMAPKKQPRRLRQNYDRARDLLREAGWQDTDGDGILDKVIDGTKVKFEFDLLVSDKPDRVAICNLLRENLDRLNIRCNVRTLEAATLLERMHERKFQACFAGWGSGADPDSSENLWKTGEARNYTGFSNPEVDRLFEEGRKELDREKRAEIYGRIAELVYEAQPYTWLFHQSSFYGFNKKLRGYMFSPRGPYHYGPGVSSIWSAKP